MGNKSEALNGQWSSDWGDVEFSVEPESEAFKGKWSQGTVEGSCDEKGKIALSWTHRSSGTKGSAALQLSDDGKAIEGTWGFDSDDKGEGDWKLELKKHKPLPKPKPPPKEEKAEEKKEEPKKADDKKADDKKADDKKADDKKADAKKK